MLSFIRFELDKIWRKKTFLLTMLMLLSANLLLIWYTNQNAKPLSEFEIAAEQEKVASYNDYLASIQERKEMLNGISIFASAEENTFSSRNIEKEAADYANLQPQNISFYPSTGFTKATQNDITDILLILSVILFASALVYEEKEKKLFYVTRATKYGRLHYITAKMAALLIHCLCMSILFYLCNILFFTATCGIGNLLCAIQSYANFMESTLMISGLEYFFLLFITKGVITFLIGLLVLCTAIKTKQLFMPYFITGIILLIQKFCYLFIPAQSALNWIKYINLFGMLQVKNLYGSYFNLNFFGYPVARRTASLTVLTVLLVIIIVITLCAFLHMKNYEVSGLRRLRFFPFRPHTNLFWHEAYKTFITNKGILILLFFSLLVGYQHFTKSYELSSGEIYYQNMMLQLEGPLTEEKELFIQEEKERYDDAFSQIDMIDSMVLEGKIDENTAESMKTPLYNETAFYPSFQRILEQYNDSLLHDTPFVYETGYALLSGILENDRTSDYILLTACMLFLFSSMFVFETQRGSWNLLSATAKGKKAVVRNKVSIAILTSLFLTLLPFVARWIQIARYCPMNQLSAPTASLSFFRGCGWSVAILVWIICMVLWEFIAFTGVTLFILFLSAKLKQQLHVLFFGVLTLLLPPILYVMGFSFSKWFSLLPLYDLTAQILLF